MIKTRKINRNAEEFVPQYAIPNIRFQVIRDGEAEAPIGQVRSPADAFAIVAPLIQHADSERFVVMLLDTKNNVLGMHTLYVGSLNTCVVRVGEVFKAAIVYGAASIILAHNHPSGDPTPSPEDVRVTELITDAGRLLDIAVLDHVVVGRNRFVSLKERSLMR